MEDWQSVLKSEFDAEEGSFLLQIRCEFVWDTNAFDRLVAAMEACCQVTAEEKLVERWVAEGFWYMSWFVKDWVSHPDFPRGRTDEYYEYIYEYLNGLAFWFFLGTSPWTDDGAQARKELGRLQDQPILTAWKG